MPFVKMLLFGALPLELIDGLPFDARHAGEGVQRVSKLMGKI